LEEIGDKYANRQACKRDLLMRGTDEHHYIEHNRACLVYGTRDFWQPNGRENVTKGRRQVYGTRDFWQPNGPDSQSASALLVP
jgi:hypothetical protein